MSSVPSTNSRLGDIFTFEVFALLIVIDRCELIPVRGAGCILQAFAPRPLIVGECNFAGLFMTRRKRVGLFLLTACFWRCLLPILLDVSAPLTLISAEKANYLKKMLTHTMFRLDKKNSPADVRFRTFKHHGATAIPSNKCVLSSGRTLRVNLFLR